MLCLLHEATNIDQLISKTMTLQFIATLKRFGEQGEKTGWTYIEISKEMAGEMLPGNKKSFRVKGRLDEYVFEGVALVPIGEGNFIMPVNGAMRKSIRKNKGAMVEVQMELDTKPVALSTELLQCLKDEPAALAFFNQLPGSHQKYFSRWIESAKTIETKTKRIAHTLNACLKNQGYSEMIRSLKE